MLVKALNFYSKKNQALDLDLLIKTMEDHSENFFSSGNDAYQIMQTESEIADITGIPFDETEDGHLLAKTTIDIDVLSEDAPERIVKLAKQIIEEMDKKK